MSARVVHVCTTDDMHPFECDGHGKCPHCDRMRGPGHDPATCALCDPEYDYAPNPYWPVSVSGGKETQP